jgi:hypothetical protein
LDRTQVISTYKGPLQEPITWHRQNLKKRKWRTTACINFNDRVRKVPKIYIFGTFLTLSLKLMQWYVTSVSRGSLYEKFGNKCVKILKFCRTELSYAQNKIRGKKMRLLGMDTCPSMNDIMEMRCNKCTRSEQGYDF